MSETQQTDSKDLEIANLKAQVDKQSKEIGGWKGKYNQQQAKLLEIQSKLSTEASLEASQEELGIQLKDTPKTETHDFSVTRPFCSTCGQKNPDFSDDVECFNCGTHLGSKKTLQKVKFCPGCGSTGNIAVEVKQK